MVRWSGEGRICWTSNPAGIRGKRRLGKDEFRRGATFLLCAHPAPERRPRGTETAGEPFLHRHAWASTSRSPSIGPFEASSLIFQELYLRTVSNGHPDGNGQLQRPRDPD